MLCRTHHKLHHKLPFCCDTTLTYPFLTPTVYVCYPPPPPYSPQVTDVDPLDQIAVEKAVESDDMADVIGDNLQEAGFAGADVEAADAQITTVEVGV